MSPTLLASMAAFALAASLSPGPVNLVALSAGMQHGFRHSLRHVTGATCGFTLLLILIWVVLQPLLAWPTVMTTIRWLGIGFLLYLAVGMALDDGHLTSRPLAVATFRRGALMQWLNPKAWMASAAGIGAFTSDADVLGVALFALLFFPICYASLAAWGALGAWLRRRLPEPRKIRWVNRSLALMLAASAIGLAVN
ncbi:LysE family translocator [Salinicola aestuarinus]|uniref:LysE family translocator n=1 Tax=Salinicola aestuarinus TaxID=1949082 RepID=UPI000DA2512C|nr:LysE family translocator [Salinicola aestuarinus]